MRKRLVVGAAVVAAVIGAAVGALVGLSGGGDSGRSASGEKGARAALVEFTDTFLDKKYDDACAALTARAKAAFDAGTSCPAALKLASGLITAAQRKDLKSRSREVKITVNGDKAIVDSITADPKDKTNLIRQDGRWFVDADSE